MITPAFAQGATSAAGGADIALQVVPFVLIFVIMYFLILKPQQKKLALRLGRGRGGKIVLKLRVHPRLRLSHSIRAARAGASCPTSAITVSPATAVCPTATCGSTPSGR